MNKKEKLKLEKLIGTTFGYALGVQSEALLDLEKAEESYGKATATVAGLENIIRELRKQESI